MERNGGLTTPPERVAVVGAGIAGLTCATSLMFSAGRVQVFERALHPGGRTAGYRERGFEFDLGAQYFTVRDELFQASVEGWLSERVVAPWRGWCVELEAGNFMARDDEQRYVAVPNMGGLAAHLAGLCEVRYGCEVRRLERGPEGLALYDALGEDLGRYDLVVFAAPPQQVRPMVAGLSPRLDAVLGGVAMTSCWALMLGFERPLSVPFDAAYIMNSPLSWAARNNSKPGRRDREAWVVHAAPEWSEAHARLSPEQAAETLLEAFGEALGGLEQRPVFKRARRWAQAAPISGLDRPYLLDPDNGVALCGDWCVAPRIEGAFLSGLALAHRLTEED